MQSQEMDYEEPTSQENSIGSGKPKNRTNQIGKHIIRTIVTLHEVEPSKGRRNLNNLNKNLKTLNKKLKIDTIRRWLTVSTT